MEFEVCGVVWCGVGERVVEEVFKRYLDSFWALVIRRLLPTTLNCVVKMFVQY